MYQEYNIYHQTLAIPVPYTFQIKPNHVVRLIIDLVDTISLDTILQHMKPTGRKAFQPAVLLKMTFFAYTQGQTSGRKIQALNEESLPMKWLPSVTALSIIFGLFPWPRSSLNKCT